MTYFKPEQKSLTNYLIALLAGASFLASFWVIWAYNRSVNLEHGISALENGIRKAQADKSDMQDRIFALLSGTDAKKFSADNGLVEEKNPHYLKIGENVPADLAISRSK